MPQIEYIALCNHAEAINGLLYLSGAGWTQHRRQATNGKFGPTHFGIGVSILVPWTETNQRIELNIRVEGEDGEPEILSVDGQVEVGRPAGLPAGTEQRTVLALNVDTVFPQPGGYRIVGRIADVDGSEKAVSFRVIDQPSPGS